MCSKWYKIRVNVLFITHYMQYCNKNKDNARLYAIQYIFKYLKMRFITLLMR
jgi:hypothetical protein